MSSCYWDEKSGLTFYYSSFPWIQGRYLRGAIKYLEALDGNLALGKQALHDAGVPLPDPTISDSSAIDEFRPVIADALALLKSWVREPSEGTDVFSNMFGGRGIGGTPSVLQSPYPMSDLLNTPFFIEKVVEEESVCPPCLLKLGLQGVFVCIEASEDRLDVSHEGAKIMVDMLDRVNPYTDWEGFEETAEDEEDEEEGEVGDVKLKKAPGTPMQQLRAVFAACAANPESFLVA
ncbi:hypothetical protein DFH07DRAFT_821967 [Mycena maculata]|uniref:Uncharacterized protein n=1 Tax=Mycena maculata TaxID=230809 RepID=A0AAD7NBX2_9AGAR|nr:hypothetical protein DFH07DRAFT_821967 [Mycena maculata]